MIKNVKKVVRDCVDKDWLDKDPFWRFRVKHIDPKVPHLSSEELKALAEKEITIPRLDLVRDMFLFSCYTGFAYVDVDCLTTEHISIGADGKKWLIKNRKKTDISERVPILPPVETILSKYAEYSKMAKAMPTKSSRKRRCLGRPAHRYAQRCASSRVCNPIGRPGIPARPQPFQIR